MNTRKTVQADMSPVLSSVQQCEATKALFGDHPEDVISPTRSAADALMWLEELFHTIASEALNERNGYRIKHLAEMGAYLALDMGNYAGSQHEHYIGRLHDAGLVDSAAVKGGAA